MPNFFKKKFDKTKYLQETYLSIEKPMLSWTHSQVAHALKEKHGLEYALFKANKQNYDLSATNPIDFIKTLKSSLNAPMLAVYHHDSHTILNTRFEVNVLHEKATTITHTIDVIDTDEPLTIESSDKLLSGKQNIVANFSTRTKDYTAYFAHPGCGYVSGVDACERLSKALCHALDDEETFQKFLV